MYAYRACEELLAVDGNRKAEGQALPWTQKKIILDTLIFFPAQNGFAFPVSGQAFVLVQGTTRSVIEILVDLGKDWPTSSGRQLMQ